MKLSTASHRKTRDEGLALVAKLLTPYILECIGATLPRANDDEPWIDVADNLPRRLKRQGFAACRAGTLEARKVARRWLTQKSKLDAWVVSHGHAPPKTESTDNISSLDELRAKLGLRKVV